MTDRARHASYWFETAPKTSFPALEGDVEVDVAIVGGGIVGISAARRLVDEGLRVAVVEARQVGGEVTGKSTAKITSQHHLKYQTIESKFGEEGARAYAEANEAGLRQILDLSAKYGIDCNIEPKAAYTYTNDEKQVSSIEKEVEVAKRLGLPASMTSETSLPYKVLAAMRWDDQAQFHPVKYVAGLAKAAAADGARIFENSRVVDWDPDRIATDRGTVKARHVIMATHMPLGQIGLFYSEAYPHIHPVIMGRVDPKRAPDGMFINIEQPRHSVRTHKDDQGDLWLVLAGTSFKAGHVDEERDIFAELETYARDTFGVEAEYKWTNEDYTPMDGAPFIGWSSSIKDGYLVATGFDAWGISNGSAAGIVLADIIAGRENPWLKVYDASRIKPIAGGPRFARGNAEVAAHLVGGYMSSKPKSFDALGRGEAAILKIDGENVAGYRDEEGRLHAVSAACTHMGCIVGWNETDRTWDCPCHGSRFELSGAVLHGPAIKPLAPKAGGAA
jgi:glycine/D-amino acid oxidase-like deaminating enzyme/nitrite reductase/ring-hydroxylating ferredoxin subunit